MNKKVESVFFEYCKNEEKQHNRFNDHDSELLIQLLEEINSCAGTEFSTLFELDKYIVLGAGDIIRKYIYLFESEEIRSCLLGNLINDRRKDCAQQVYRLYMHFKASEDYNPPAGVPGPFSIYISYDNAFKRLKPKIIKKELIELARNPRDALYLYHTMCMLASWKIPELESVFLSYFDGSGVTLESLGLPSESEEFHPPFSFIKKQLKFCAIHCLRYYPTEHNINLLRDCLNDSNKDICSAAEKSLRFCLKRDL